MTAPALRERCTYFYRGTQCDGRRYPGSNRCAIHGGRSVYRRTTPPLVLDLEQFDGCARLNLERAAERLEALAAADDGSALERCYAANAAATIRGLLQLEQGPYFTRPGA